MDIVPPCSKYLEDEAYESLAEGKSVFLGDRSCITFKEFSQLTVASVSQTGKISFFYKKEDSPREKLTIYIGEETPLFKHLIQQSGRREHEQSLRVQALILNYLVTLLSVHEIAQGEVDEISAQFDKSDRCTKVLSGETEISDTKVNWREKNERRVSTVKDRFTYLATDRKVDGIFKKVIQQRDLFESRKSKVPGTKKPQPKDWKPKVSETKKPQLPRDGEPKVPKNRNSQSFRAKNFSPPWVEKSKPSMDREEKLDKREKNFDEVHFSQDKPFLLQENPSISDISNMIKGHNLLFVAKKLQTDQAYFRIGNRLFYFSPSEKILREVEPNEGLLVVGSLDSQRWLNAISNGSEFLQENPYPLLNPPLQESVMEMIQIAKKYGLDSYYFSLGGVRYFVDDGKLMSEEGRVLLEDIESAQGQKEFIRSFSLNEEMNRESVRFDRDIMDEYRQLNPGDQDGEFNRIRNKMLFIQKLREGQGRVGNLAQELNLSEWDEHVCRTISSIAEKFHIIENRKKYPRDNQILSVLLFLDGKKTSLAQIKTGQGKTFIAAMTAIARKMLYNEKVCILTTTEPLALSGYKEMQELYESCGVSVGCFDGRGFQGGSASEDYDVVYTTSFGLECDKIAKKKDNTHKLKNIWETPCEKLQGVVQVLMHKNPSEFGGIINESKELIARYQETPSRENEETLKKFLERLRELQILRGLPELDPYFKGFCLLVDECDSVLYDHAGSRVQSTIQIPYAKRIKEYGLEVARRVKVFYERPDPTELEIEDFSAGLKFGILGLVRKEFENERGKEFIIDYFEEEIDQWIKDALKVFKPGDPDWRDGKNYMRAPSFTTLLRDTLGNILPHLETQLVNIKNLFPRGLELAEELVAMERREDVRKEEIEACAKKLSQYLPLLFQALTEEYLVETLKLPEYKNLKDSLIKLFDKAQQMNLFSNPSPIGLREPLLENHIRYVEKGTSQIIEKMKFGDLVHLFLEYKEYVRVVHMPTTALNLQSQFDVIRDADCIVGFTGTLPDETLHTREYVHFKAIVEKAYGKGDEEAKMKIIPDFIKSKKEEEDPIICENEREWKKAILNKIRQKKDRQAILVVCETPGAAWEMELFLRSEELGKISTYIEGKGDEKVIQENYSIGDIVITTALGSRGTDWHVKAEDGLHVLCTYKPDDMRTQIQISGRAARSGQKGSYGEISIRTVEARQSKIAEIDESIRQAFCNDLFSDLYRMFEAEMGSSGQQKEVKEAGKKHLILWMTKRKTRENLLKAIRKKLNDESDANNDLEQMLKEFYGKFTDHFLGREENLCLQYWWRIKRWYDKRASLWRDMAQT